ncbi:MAG: GntR family transcriptional regulator [Rhodobacteraceae bacterium]|nr:GntR family transcriptional regulator [Paracoccaceae bacterium]
MDSKSDLQLRLVRRILKLIVDGSLKPGDHLRETELSSQFGVSRSPVRAALAQLASLGAVDRADGRGMSVAVDPAAAQRILGGLPLEDEEQIRERIARDWFEGRIPREISENSFRSRYGLGKMTLSRVLSVLSDEGIISRMPGYGWQFEPTLNSLAANDASYDFRFLVEPGAMLQSSFVYDAIGAAAIRARHERILSDEQHSLSELFRLDEEFHLFIAGCSHNSFVVQAVAQQNKLRRLLEYESLIDMGRLNSSCQEHVAILDALDVGDRGRAAEAMRQHLRAAKAAAPKFATDLGALGFPGSSDNA